MTGHLDLDALADVVAGAGEPPHLSSCGSCQAAVAELRDASTTTTAALAALPSVPMPADVSERLSRSFLDAGADDAADAPAVGTLTTLPTRPAAKPGRWLTAAAAAVIVLAGGGYGISRLANRTSHQTASGAAAAAAPTAGLVRNNSGNDYGDRAALVAAVPGLLRGAVRSADAFTTKTSDAPPKAAGTKPVPGSNAAGSNAGAPADPLARLRTDAGLADCLVALLPPDDASVKPLAVDYGAFRGRPAMIVLLPSSLPKKVDIFVVGAGCSRANDSTMFYTSADRS